MENLDLSKEKNKLEELKEAIANAPKAIEDEFSRTANSWLACFGSSVSVIETYLDNSEVKALFSSEKYTLATEKMEDLKRRLVELEEQYPGKNAILPENIKDIKAELLMGLLSILLAEDEAVALSSEFKIVGRCFSIWHKRLEEYKKNRKDFLVWIKNAYSPQRVYYPGSGNDKIPKEIFGEDKVIHLSLGPKNRGARGYFTHLGSGHKIEGDFLKSPFKDKSFDAVFIHDTPCSVTIQGLEEFYRVLKNEGILILDNGCWDQKELEEFFIAARQLFEGQSLPSQFNNPDNMLANVSKRIRENSEEMEKSIIATSEDELERILKNIPPARQSVVRQLFAVFQKK